MRYNSIQERETDRLKRLRAKVVEFFQNVDFNSSGERRILEETYEKFICHGIWSDLTEQERTELVEDCSL